MTVKVLARYSNNEERVTSEVAAISLGYSVVLRDDDSGQIVPGARIFKDATPDRAIEYAKELVGIDGRKPGLVSVPQ